MDLPLTHIIVKPFGITRWNLLLKLVTQPDVKHQSGGFQNRKAKWRMHLNEADHSIELDEDDIGWIQRKIRSRKGGGWQKQIAEIFAGQHPLFSGILPDPRRRPEDRRKRPLEGGLGA